MAGKQENKGRTALIATVIAALLLSCMATTSHAKPDLVAEEYQIKAAYLYRFLAFIHRDSDTGFPRHTKQCSIAIIGKDPFGNSFAPVEGRKIPGSEAVVRIDRQDEIKAASTNDCHIVFICRSEKERVAMLLEQCRHIPVLTVSDMEGFLEAGGMLCLVQVDGRLRWEISLPALKAAGLRLDAQLLRNAIRVTGESSTPAETREK